MSSNPFIYMGLDFGRGGDHLGLRTSLQIMYRTTFSYTAAPIKVRDRGLGLLRPG